MMEERVEVSFSLLKIESSSLRQSIQKNSKNLFVCFQRLCSWYKRAMVKELCLTFTEFTKFNFQCFNQLQSFFKEIACKFSQETKC